jgi:carbon-monoxide dehydrogenase large subunit
MQARECLVEASAAFSTDGALLGVRVRQTFNQGAYVLPLGLVPASRAAVLVPGAYRVSNVESEVRCAYTNTAPTGPYRGAGRPEASFVIERLMELGARDLGIDPVELRRRNLLSASEFPYQTPTGQRYDSGNYPAALDRLVELADYARLRADQLAARARGELVGIGLATFVEPSGGAIWEGAHVRVERSGEVIVLTGAGSHGQGHDTIFGQIAADALQVAITAVRVRRGDTAVVPPGVGSFGSRTAALAGSAVLQAAERVEAKARRIAAHVLECDPADIQRVDGGFAVAGATGRSIKLQHVAAAAYGGFNLPAGEEPGLEAQVLYKQVDEMFGFGAYLAVVHVDAETGLLRLQQLSGVDDSGVLINPLLAEGQIHGGIAQGLAQAVLEQVVYDASGQLLTSSLLDYALPRAGAMPPLWLDHRETPSPLNPLGAKGVGEAGAVGTPAAIVNAVVDALAEFGVRHLDMPVTSEAVWHVLNNRQA